MSAPGGTTASPLCPLERWAPPYTICRELLRKKLAAGTKMLRSQATIEIREECRGTEDVGSVLRHHRLARLRAAIAQRLGDVQAAHRLGAVEIGQGARHPQGAMPGAGRQAEPLGSAGQRGAAFGIGLGDGRQQRAVGVAPSVSALHLGLDQLRARSDSRPALGSASTAVNLPLRSSAASRSR